MNPTTPSIAQGLVVFAKDKSRVSAFYSQSLGLRVVEQARSHDLLQGAGIEVVIHAIPPRLAAEITITEPPQRREDTPLKPTFVVNDLDLVRAAVMATGGWLKPLDEAWRFRGFIVLDGCDPEGNIVQFKQPEP